MQLVNKLLLIPLLLWGFFSCQAPVKTSNNKAIEQTDTCLSDRGHSYEVFIPAVEQSLTSLPLLVVADSHGDGKLALSKFRDAAVKYPAVIAASNLIRNNDLSYMQELDELIADVKKRYPVGNTLYLSGFSGGARMVLNYATKHTVNGVIACGAFAGSDQVAAIKCPVMAVIGMDDFNFTEVVQYVLNPDRNPPNAHIELIKASHAWPDKKLLRQAFGWFQLLENGSVKKQQIKQYAKEQQIRIDSLKGSGNLLQAVCIARNMASAEKFEKTGSFRSITDELTNSIAYKQQKNELINSIRFEMKVREAYSKALMQKDSVWWLKEIISLNDKIGTEPNMMTQMTYKRIKGFLGIMCYSYCNRFAMQKDTKSLEQILMVYRLVEPNNADMIHFSEVLTQQLTARQ